jgi:serine/threonine protein kinase
MKASGKSAVLRRLSYPALNDYAVNEKLGAGSFAEVRACTNNRSGHKCAIKIVDLLQQKPIGQKGSMEKPIAKDSMGAHGLAINEGRSWQECQSHENVVDLYETIVADGFVYFVMEKCSYSLAALFNNRRSELIPSLDFYFYQMLLALEHIHSKAIVHRDVKPANFLVSREGTIKICDFGLALYEEDLVGKVLAGSPLYQAPEMLRKESHGCPIDMWSLGVSMYVLEFRHYPYALHGDDLAQLARSIKSNNPPPSYLVASGTPAPSAAMVAVIKQLIDHDSEQRKTATECLQLQPVVKHASTVPLPLEPTSPTSPQSIQSFDSPKILCDDSPISRRGDKKRDPKRYHSWGTVNTISSISTTSTTDTVRTSSSKTPCKSKYCSSLPGQDTSDVLLRQQSRCSPPEPDHNEGFDELDALPEDVPLDTPASSPLPSLLGTFSQNRRAGKRQGASFGKLYAGNFASWS